MLLDKLPPKLSKQLCKILFRSALLTIVVVNQMNSIALSADENYKHWSDLRFQGLIEFAKGHYPSACQSFEKALAYAQNHKPASQEETWSAYDLAQVYQYMGKRDKESEFYYKRALSLATKSFSSHSPESLLFLQDLLSLMKTEHREEECARLDRQLEKLISEHPESNTIGTASINNDGTIEMYLQAKGPGGMSGHSFMKYTPTDSDYKYTILHLGPMKVGEQKVVLPYREDPDAPKAPPAPPLPPPKDN